VKRNNKIELNSLDILMHDLIFGKNEKYEIDLNEYISEIQDAEEFTTTIINNLLLSGIDVIEQTLYLVKNKKTWTLSIKRD